MAALLAAGRGVRPVRRVDAAPPADCRILRGPPPAASKEPEGDCVITGSRSAKARDAELMRDAITVADSDAEQEGAPPKRIPFLPRNAPGAPRRFAGDEPEPEPVARLRVPVQCLLDEVGSLQDKVKALEAERIKDKATIAELEKQSRSRAQSQLKVIEDAAGDVEFGAIEARAARVR
ncbi:hypothetical protein JL720_16818 [Aureococcus anophagefferens]|nr:hypothetical protein JL720_16818 [Aureococcus anophagefferens]